MRQTLEWRMVAHLMTRLPMMEKHEMKFIIDMDDFLDPHASYLSQCSEKQLNWLHILFKKYQRHEVKNGK